MNLDVLIPLQAVSTFAMFGLIWLVQLVLYPAFSYVEASQFRKFHFFHTQRITFIVGPLMCLELAASLGVFLLQPNALWGGGLALTIAIWLHTLFVSVPIHNCLGIIENNEQRLVQIHRLVQTNWWRTVLWTVRSALVLYAIFI
jgi:hypothetical protein